MVEDPESSPGRARVLLGFRRAMKPQGPKKKISASSLREAFRKIIWPRRRLVLLGLLLIAVLLCIVGTIPLFIGLIWVLPILAIAIGEVFVATFETASAESLKTDAD